MPTSSFMWRCLRPKAFWCRNAKKTGTWAEEIITLTFFHQNITTQSMKMRTMPPFTSYHKTANSWHEAVSYTIACRLWCCSRLRAHLRWMREVERFLNLANFSVSWSRLMPQAASCRPSLDFHFVLVVASTWNPVKQLQRKQQGSSTYVHSFFAVTKLR